VLLRLRAFEYGRRRAEWGAQMQTHHSGKDEAAATSVARIPTESTSNLCKGLKISRSIELRQLVEACPGLKQSVLLGFHVHGSHLLAYTNASNTSAPPLTRVGHDRQQVDGRHVRLEMWRTDFAGTTPEAHLWHSIAVPIEDSPHLRDVGHPVLSVTQSACGRLLAVAAPVQVGPESLDVRLTLAPLALQDPAVRSRRTCVARLLDLRFTANTTDNSTVPNEYHIQEMHVAGLTPATARNSHHETRRDERCLVLCLNLGDVLSFQQLQVRTHTSDSRDDNDECAMMSEPLWGADSLSRDETIVQPWLSVGGRDGVERMISRVRCVDIGGNERRALWAATAAATRLGVRGQESTLQGEEDSEHDEDGSSDGESLRIAPTRHSARRSRPMPPNIWQPPSPADATEQGQVRDTPADAGDDGFGVDASVAIVDTFKIQVQPLLVAALATKGIYLTPSQAQSASVSRRGPTVSSSSTRILLSYCAQLIRMDPLRNVAEVSMHVRV
jgi:hypothetical protein